MFPGPDDADDGVAMARSAEAGDSAPNDVTELVNVPSAIRPVP